VFQRGARVWLVLRTGAALRPPARGGGRPRLPRRPRPPGGGPHRRCAGGSRLALVNGCPWCALRPARSLPRHLWRLGARSQASPTATRRTWPSTIASSTPIAPARPHRPGTGDGYHVKLGREHRLRAADRGRGRSGVLHRLITAKTSWIRASGWAWPSPPARRGTGFTGQVPPSRAPGLPGLCGPRTRQEISH
jgi:hypothetical protein